MSALPRPDLPHGSHRDLVDALHDLHHRAGWPSLRTLAKAAGCSHTTVSAVFSRPGLPAWGILELLVEAMDGDVDEFHRLWLAASAPDGHAAVAGSAIAGRRAELAVARRHVAAGEGLLVVTGEAGIGKTTLVTGPPLAGRLASSPVGHCLPLSTEVPLLPVADCLRSVLRRRRRGEVRRGGCRLPAVRRRVARGLLPEATGGRDDTSHADGRHVLFTAVGAILARLTSRVARAAARGPALGRPAHARPARAPPRPRSAGAPPRHLAHGGRRVDPAERGLVLAGPAAARGHDAPPRTADQRRDVRAAQPHRGRPSPRRSPTSTTAARGTLCSPSSSPPTPRAPTGCPAAPRRPPRPPARPRLRCRLGRAPHSRCRRTAAPTRPARGRERGASRRAHHPAPRSARPPADRLLLGRSGAAPAPSARRSDQAPLGPG